VYTDSSSPLLAHNGGWEHLDRRRARIVPEISQCGTEVRDVQDSFTLRRRNKLVTLDESLIQWRHVIEKARHAGSATPGLEG
jgi:hypothetical protein